MYLKLFMFYLDLELPRLRLLPLLLFLSFRSPFFDRDFDLDLVLDRDLFLLLDLDRDLFLDDFEEFELRELSEEEDEEDERLRDFLKKKKLKNRSRRK